MSRAQPDFDDLVRDHAGLVSRIASSYERRPALIEEVVQEVLLTVFRALPNWRGDASLKTFIARIAHNVGVDHVRKASRRPREIEGKHAVFVADPSGNAEDQTDLALKRAMLMDAVRTLPLPLRQVMTLHLEGFSNAEIADAFSLSASNVGVRLHRAKGELTKQLSGAAQKEAVR
ncbi:MAG: sigma-70 family RNA polymerase sigma factor [Pseudomonadota bacterium]